MLGRATGAASCPGAASPTRGFAARPLGTSGGREATRDDGDPHAPPTRTIVVTGDVTIDWLFLSDAPRRNAALDFIWMWGGDYACRALACAGGAASHADILRRTVQVGGHEHVDVVGARVPRDALASPRHPSFAHTFADIEQFPREAGAGRGTAWRIAEFKGTDRARRRPPAPAAAARGGHRADRRPRHRLPRPLPRPAGLLAASPSPSSGRPAPLWRARRSPACCSTEHADRLTVLTSSDELRKAGLQVGYPLSWERLTEEVIAAVRAHPLAQGAPRHRHRRRGGRRDRGPGRKRRARVRPARRRRETGAPATPAWAPATGAAWTPR